MSLGDRIRRAFSETSKEDAAEQTPQELAEASERAVEELVSVSYSELVREHLLEAVNDLALARYTTRTASEKIDELLAMGVDPGGELPTMMKDGFSAQTKASVYLGALVLEVERRSADDPTTVEATAGVIRAALDAGPYAVRALSFGAREPVPFEWFGGGDFLFGTAVAMLGHVPDEARDLGTKLEHVGPQVIVTDVSLEAAVELKRHLESAGMSAEIKEGRPVLRSAAGREPIPERVRNEVWRRDNSQCVDCGSRERLEFDHIIPLSKGGSNTARNIELRCETCNRAKADRI